MIRKRYLCNVRAALAAACLAMLCLACAVGIAACGSAREGNDGALQPGDTFVFGAFEQDGNFANGAEPITWVVLDTDPAFGRVFAITEMSIYTMLFNSSIDQGNDWATSELHSWLTGEFANTAFTAEERTRMVGELSLLSLDEVLAYYPTDESRICYPSEYARMLDAFVAGGPGCAWWLTTLGEQWYTVARVLPDGSVWSYGDEVVGNCGGVRPVAWIRL